jgi:hypothetical protein
MEEEVVGYVLPPSGPVALTDRPTVVLYTKDIRSIDKSTIL